MTRGVLGVGLVGAMLLSGCSEQPKKKWPWDKQANNIARINLAFRGQEDFNKPPPRDEQHLRKCIEFHVGPPDISVDDPNLLVSPRDGQPYVIIYGAITDQQEGSPNVYVAHEKNGLEGKRYVITERGRMVLVTDAEFAKMTPAEKKPFKRKDLDQEMMGPPAPE